MNINLLPKVRKQSAAFIVYPQFSFGGASTIVSHHGSLQSVQNTHPYIVFSNKKVKLSFGVDY